jgi:hypothetical protein
VQTGQSGFVGRHRVERQLADRLDLAVRGDVSNEDVVEIINIVRQVRRECGYSLILADVSEMGSIPPATRKLAAAEMKKDGQYMSAICLIGASLITRSLVTLILRAVSLIGGTSDRILGFPSNWQAGIEWTDRHRFEFLRRLARHSKPG